jgi:hypothetical protein
MHKILIARNKNNAVSYLTRFVKYNWILTIFYIIFVQQNETTFVL